MIEYQLKRSDRKSVAISVSSANEIRVLAPNGLSQKKIDEFVNGKSAWIDRVMAENRLRLDEGKDVIGYRKILLCGKQVPLFLGGEDGIDGQGVHSSNVKHIKNVYITYVSPEFMAAFREICSETGLSAASVQLKSYKSRWGSCDADNHLKFNFKLMMLPVGAWRYVIVHELCHTVYHNHSARFWSLVKRYCPDCAFWKKKLKEYSYIVDLY